MLSKSWKVPMNNYPSGKLSKAISSAFYLHLIRVNCRIRRGKMKKLRKIIKYNKITIKISSIKILYTLNGK